uniref:CSON014869 protein n=1 Tax=Culicoides sonorensis TaxID=179676 RepID=A0A336MC56_CULSO
MIRSIDDATAAPPALVQKYNRFVDQIFGKINRILGRSYDPVSVHLTNFEAKNNNHKSKQRQRSNSKRRSNSGEPELESSIKSDESPSIETSSMSYESSSIESQEKPVNVSAVPEETSRQQKKDKNRRKNTEKPESKQKPKQANVRASPKGTLYGLSSIKRSGNVKLNQMADYTSVKSNFLLGPLILKVEKQFGKGTKRELRLATATTQEMIGRITLRIVNGAATLHSIKVQQPKQVPKRVMFKVRVDTPDNHDRTREYVWKRSSNIAPLVSQKLTSAVRSMLRPPPKNKTLQITKHLF